MEGCAEGLVEEDGGTQPAFSVGPPRFCDLVVDFAHG